MALGIIIGMLALFTVLTLAGVWWKMRTRKMSPASRMRIDRAWAIVRTMNDPVRKVLEADKVLDMALAEAGFSGNLGAKLKKAGSRFSDINAVWRAHKLRNRLAHESGAHISQAEADSVVRVFEKAIMEL